MQNIAAHQAQRQYQAQIALAREKAVAADMSAAMYRLVALRLPPSVRKIVVYGSGQAGRILLAVCRECGIRVAGLTDSDSSRWAENVDGVQILPPEECLNLECDDWVIASLAFADEIERSILRLGNAAGRKLRTFRAD